MKDGTPTSDVTTSESAVPVGQTPALPTEHASPSTEPLIVGIGSSAGGLEALKLLISELPSGPGFCYLIAQHLSPYHSSILVQILERAGPHLTFEVARSGAIPRSQTVFITPPNHDLILRDGKLLLTKPSHEVGPKPSVDQLLISMAEDVGERAVAIILSGTGSDGSHGLRSVKAHGGLTFAQQPDSAQYDGMPTAAIHSGQVDHILKPEDIGKYLARMGTSSPAKGLPANTPRSAIAELLDLLNVKYRVNFSQYKEGTINRQLARRMSALQIESVEAYLAFVKSTPEEVDRLYQSFLISVTSFFRDREAWDGLRNVLADRIREIAPGDTMRVWVAGCATGEEAYTVAILLTELFDELGRGQDFKIFATDLDDQALEFARQGMYSAAQIDKLAPATRSRFFLSQGSYYRITKSLRETVVFARHNLAGDPPFFSLDLVCCRNLFIYLIPTLQTHLLQVFQHALLKGGLLFLGQSESVDDPSLFRPIELPRGLYMSVGERRPLRIDRTGSWGDRSNSMRTRTALRSSRPSLTDRARDLILMNYSPATILVDENYRALHFFGPVKELLELGRGSADLSLFALLPAELRVPVRALVNRAAKDGDEATLVLRRADAAAVAARAVRCVVRPVQADSPALRMFLISFETVQTVEPSTVAVESTDDKTGLLIATLERELAETRENLQSVIEEIETSNEELQSLNEEMQAGSEELQASNEELQTTNEELQSTNEELQTVNEELQIRTAELGSANSYMENLQSAIDLALIVVDTEFRILRFSPSATRLFEVLPTDVGRPLSTIKSSVDHAQLELNVASVVRSVRQYSEQMIREGRNWLLRINPYFDGSHKVSGAVLSFTDVTELSSARHDLAIHAAALEASADGMVIADAKLPDMPIIYATASFSTLTGYAKAEVIGQNCRFLQGRDTDPEAVRQIREAIKSQRSLVIELINYRKDGTPFWCELRLSPVFDSGGQLAHYAGMQSDVSKRRESEAAVQLRANFDALTGLANRVSMLSRLGRILESARKHGDNTYLMFIDLDGFKEINDTLGHGLGDELLVQAAIRLKSCVRESDVIARFGGDEFVIVFPEVPGLDVMMRLANTILSRMREPFKLLVGTHRLSASIGISAYPADASDAEKLIQHADTAMYRAKANGRDGFAFFQAAMNEEAVTRSSTKQAIFEGIENNQFELNYQPIVDLATGRVVGAEALLRWQHPQTGLTMPDAFVPIAEDTGQIVPLGNWVLEQAAKQLHNWQGQLDPEFRLSVNLAARQLNDEAFQDALGGLPDAMISRLDFEITESAFVGKHRRVMESLAMIRDRGGRIVLDDFGIGYSSLRFLMNFRVDTLKIDRTFLATDLSQERNAALVQAIFSLAKSIGACVVAEGIESDEQLGFVKDLGCQRAQGFMFAHPLGSNEFERLYAQHKGKPLVPRAERPVMH